MNIIWHNEAIMDLDEIYDYYVVKSNRVATNIFNQIMTDIEKLINHPFIAAKEPILSDCIETYRSLVVPEHFKVIYFVDEENEAVVITKIWDCRQNPKNLKISQS